VTLNLYTSDKTSAVSACAQ